MQAYGYGASCSAPALSGFGRDDGMGYGMGAVSAAVAARQAAAKAKQAANKVAVANRQAAAKAKRLAKVAGKTVSTSNPAAASALDTHIKSAQAATQNVLALAATARKSKSKVDYQKALAAGNAALSTIKEVMSKPASATPAAANVAATTKLRGMGYMGSCVVDPSTGMTTDNGDGQGCPQIGVQPGYPGGGVAPSTYLPQQYSPSSYGTPVASGFPIISAAPQLVLPTYVSNRVRSCSNGSNSAFCIIYNMSVDEQSQFQYVFQILQQMYAQLLTIVQQLMSELGSAQQQPYTQYPPASPYGTPPYDPNNPYGQYGQSPYGPQSPYGAQYGQQPYGYGGQYQGPGGYYSGGDSSQIPAGYDGGGDSSGVPASITQTYPGPGGQYGGGYPMMSPGGPPPGLVSSDQLPVGADQQSGDGSGDDAAGIVPQAQSGPNLAPQYASQGVSSSINAPVSATPQIIVLQQGPGQSPYSDAALPAGNRQNQPGLDPSEHDDLTDGY